MQPFFFFSRVHAKWSSWSQAFLAETMETGDKYLGVTKSHTWKSLIKICERCRVFRERVGPQILSLENIDYFGTSEYFSGPKKRRIFNEQNFEGEAM